MSTARFDLWLDPADHETIAALLNEALGEDAWCVAQPEEAVLGLFAQPEAPADLDPFLPLIALHPEVRVSPMGCWIQALPEPSPEELCRAIENVMALREIDVFDRAIFEALRNNSNDAIYLLDDQGFFVFVNRKFQSLMGLSFEEVCTPNFEFARLVSPMGMRVIAEREAAFKAGRRLPPQYEFEAADSRGRSFPVEVSTSRIVFRGRVATLGILRDISEKKAAQRALERQNRELRTLNDVATVVNQGAELDAVLERTLEVLEGNFGFDAYLATVAEDRDSMYRVVAQRGMPMALRPAIAQQQSYEVPRKAQVSERVMVFPDLREADQEAGLVHEDIPLYFRLKLLVPIFHGDRAMGTLQAYARDPSAYDELDAQLVARVANQLGPAMYRNRLHLEQERQIRHLRTLDGLATAVAEFRDEEGLLHRVADAGFEISQADSMTLWWSDDEGQMRPRHRRGDGTEHEVPPEAFGRLDYGPSWLSSDGRLFVFIGNGAQPLGVMSFYWRRDTLELAARVETLELLASHAALAQRQRVLQAERDNALHERFEWERLEGLGRLAAGVAHDFNNVLAAILGRAQLLKRQVTQEGLLESLAVIEQAALDGAGTVRRIQEFSRQSPIEPDPDAVAELCEVVRDTVAQTSSNFERRAGGHVHLSLQLGDPTFVQADARELREVLVNLVHNALDAMTGGGSLWLGVERDEGVGVLVCRDDGGGIPESVLEHIFDPFFTTKGVQGTGLGLAVSFGIIHRFGGRIDVDSVEGEGTTFRLRLPLAASPQVAPQEEAPADEPARGAGRDIVVAEDDELVRELLVHILTDGGYEVRAAENGAAALALVGEREPALVLSDLGMPVLDGWGVAERLRSEHPHVKLGFITGWGATLDPEEARQAGASLVLAKPFRYEEVLKQLGQVLSP